MNLPMECTAIKKMIEDIENRPYLTEEDKKNLEKLRKHYAKMCTEQLK